MTRSTLRAAVAAGTAAVLTLLGAAAQADPDPGNPGQPIPGKTDSQLYAAVGADAFAELTNNIVSNYNSQQPAPTDLLESYDAVDPVDPTNTANITTKPGCSVARPNGANAGITAILLNQKSDAGSGGDGTSYCIDWVRSSRAKGTAAGEANLTFYAQSRDAVTYATLGNAYAPTTPLTTAQLKDIFECTDTGLERRRRPAGADPPVPAPVVGRHADVLPAGDRHQPDERQRRVCRSAHRVHAAAERRSHDER